MSYESPMRDYPSKLLTGGLMGEEESAGQKTPGDALSLGK